MLLFAPAKTPFRILLAAGFRNNPYVGVCATTRPHGPKALQELHHPPRQARQWTWPLV